MRREIVALCVNKWFCECPKIFVDDEDEKLRQISITDDFGNTIFISKEQFMELVHKAKEGHFQF